MDLPPEAVAIDPREISTIKIDEIGEFDVLFRWRKRDRVGLVFHDRASAQPVLNTYFRKLGDFPV